MQDTDPDSLIAAADAARERGDGATAIELYRCAHVAAPSRIYPLYWLSTLVQEAGDVVAADRYVRLGLEQDPDQIALLLRSGSIAHDAQDPAKALASYRRVAELDPDVPEIDARIADQLCFLGRLDEAMAAFDRALARAPTSVQVQQSRLFCLNFSDRIPPAALFEEHRRWGQACERAIPIMEPAGAARATTRDRLRVGYVSPDLRNHAVAHFVAPLFAHHDRKRFQIVVFDTATEAADAVTAQLETCVDRWLRVADLSDEALAAAIRDAGIDILVDVSGHTKGNRLLAFARKPAPIQVTWLGYLSTTGLSRMDYRLTDACMDPPGLTESLHTERLVRLPVQGCFAPASDPVSAGPLPGGSGVPLTLASVNQWPKVSARAKDVWAGVLTTVPDARLEVVARGGQTPALKSAIAADFSDRGVDPGRINVNPFMAAPDFLRFLRKVDIALDSFPYGGGTTTMQCLWMGVPVVTLAGVTALSRNAVGPLTALGLQALVASSPAEYRAIVARLAANRDARAEMRQGLRKRMASSLLSDGAAFAASVEGAYAAMWREYVGTQGAA